MHGHPGTQVTLDQLIIASLPDEGGRWTLHPLLRGLDASISGAPEPIQADMEPLGITLHSLNPLGERMKWCCDSRCVVIADAFICRKYLGLALVHLDATCVTLEECSDFWLMLHSAELQLRKIEKEATHLSQPTGLSDGGLRLQGFCERVSDFCKARALRASLSSSFFDL